MLLDSEDKRTTPKRFAQDLIFDQLVQLVEGYWQQDLRPQDGYKGATQRELEQVDLQIRKIADRIAKMMGFEPAFMAMFGGPLQDRDS